MIDRPGWLKDHPGASRGGSMIFYDFEVTKYDWLVVGIDPFEESKHVIVNDRDELAELYERHSTDVWVGFNNRHYDQYIMKGILLEMDPKKINDWIIVLGKEGWEYSRAFNQIQMINYDVMPNPPVGLKTIEGLWDQISEKQKCLLTLTGS